METYLRIFGMTDCPLKIKVKNPIEARRMIGISVMGTPITLRIDRIGILQITSINLGISDLTYNCKMSGIIGDDNIEECNDGWGCQYCGYEGCDQCYDEDVPPYYYIGSNKRSW